jgi:hypothetical protein
MGVGEGRNWVMASSNIHSALMVARKRRKKRRERVAKKEKKFPKRKREKN